MILIIIIKSLVPPIRNYYEGLACKHLTSSCRRKWNFVMLLLTNLLVEGIFGKWHILMDNCYMLVLFFNSKNLLLLLCTYFFDTIGLSTFLEIF